MKQVEFKNKVDVKKGDTLKRIGTREYCTVDSEYSYMENDSYKYVMFKGFSVPKNSLNKFFETDNFKMCVYGE